MRGGKRAAILLGVVHRPDAPLPCRQNVNHGFGSGDFGLVVVSERDTVSESLRGRSLAHAEKRARGGIVDLGAWVRESLRHSVCRGGKDLGTLSRRRGLEDIKELVERDSWSEGVGRTVQVIYDGFWRALNQRQ